MAANPMNLNLPVPETTTGPAWAQQLNTQLEDVVAEHDHTSGKGVQLTQEALNITNELTLNNNDLVAARTVRLENLAGTPSNPNDTNVLFSENGNLGYINADGDLIGITVGNAINVNSVGGITGLGAPAEASFNAGTFTFKNTAINYATVAQGPLELYSGVDGNPVNAVTIKSPNNLEDAYDFTMPLNLPEATSFLTLGTTGQVGLLAQALGISTGFIANNAITPAKMATLSRERTEIDNVGINGTVGVYESVGGLLSLTGTGRPIYVALQGNVTSTPASGESGFRFSQNNATTVNAWSLRVLVNFSATPTGFFGEQSWLVRGTYTLSNPGKLPALYSVILPGHVGAVTIRLQVRNDNTLGFSTFQSILGAEFIAFQL